jgi:hypothetical protein
VHKKALFRHFVCPYTERAFRMSGLQGKYQANIDLSSVGCHIADGNGEIAGLTNMVFYSLGLMLNELSGKTVQPLLGMA